MNSTEQPAVAGPAVEQGVGRLGPERDDDRTLYRWLVEEFGPNGNSTGRYMRDQGDLTITSDVYQARQFLRLRTAMFRAEDMRGKHGGDWRHTQHGFVADSKTPNVLVRRE